MGLHTLLNLQGSAEIHGIRAQQQIEGFMLKSK